MFICWTSMLCKPSPSQICDFRTDEGVDTHCWNNIVKSNCCFNYRETLNISRSLYYAQYWPTVIILHTLTTPSTLVSLFFFEEGAVLHEYSMKKRSYPVQDQLKQLDQWLDWFCKQGKITNFVILFLFHSYSDITILTNV